MFSLSVMNEVSTDTSMMSVIDFGSAAIVDALSVDVGAGINAGTVAEVGHSL